MKILATFAIALAFSISTPMAEAANDYESTANGCVPYSAFPNYENPLWGTVKTGLTGQVRFFCPVVNATSIDAPSYLQLQYHDSSTVAGNYVTATLYRVNKSTGDAESIAFVNSGTAPCNSGDSAIHYCDDAIDGTWAPLTYRYYVLVDLARTSTAHDVRFWAVSVY